MNPSAAGDVRALAWVQVELRRSLDATHKALRRQLKEAESRIADVDAADPALQRVARMHLHQCAGALELVGMQVPARVLRASEAAVQRMVARPALLNTDSLHAIEQASFALLDFLGRVVAGKPLSPLVLFPQYAAVQHLAGAERIHPADLWPHEWQWRELPAEAGVLARAPDDAARSVMEALVLASMRSPEPAVLEQMSALAAELGAGAQGTAATLWRLAAAFFEARAGGLLSGDLHVKRVASRLLALLRSMVRGHDEVSDRLAQDMLFFCAHARAPAPGQVLPRLAAVRHTWALDTAGAAAVDYDTPRLGRFDPALLAQARKRVVTAKDVWASLASGEEHRLSSLAESFALVGDSLQQLYPAGEALARALQDAARMMADGLQGLPPALAMEVATALLYLEASLQDSELDDPALPARVQHLARRIDEVRMGADPQPLDSWMEELYRRVSDRQTMGSVVQELRATLTAAEEQIDQYFRDPSQRERLIAVPAQLSTMRGVLSVLGLDQASQAVLHMRDDVDALAQTEVDPQRAVGAGTFDRLADNLGALSFLIDMLSVQPALAKSLFQYDPETGNLRALVGRSERISAFAAFDAETEAPRPAPAAPVEEVQGVGAVEALESLEAVESVESFEAVAGGAARVPAARPVADAETLAVFLEEARELLLAASESLRELAVKPASLTAMIAMRRAFHTLKGSAHMVGLQDFGEAAWHGEQLYNVRLADDARCDSALLQFSTEALDYLRSWVDAIEAGCDGGHAWPAVAMAADALREGRGRVALPPPGGATAALARVPVPAAADFSQRLEDVADEESMAEEPALDESVAERPAGTPKAVEVQASEEEAFEQAGADEWSSTMMFEETQARPAAPTVPLTLRLDVGQSLSARVPGLPSAADLDLLALPLESAGLPPPLPALAALRTLPALPAPAAASVPALASEPEGSPPPAPAPELAPVLEAADMFESAPEPATPEVAFELDLGDVGDVGDLGDVGGDIAAPGPALPSEVSPDFDFTLSLPAAAAAPEAEALPPLPEVSAVEVEFDLEVFDRTFPSAAAPAQVSEDAEVGEVAAPPAVESPMLAEPLTAEAATAVTPAPLSISPAPEAETWLGPEPGIGVEPDADADAEAGFEEEEPVKLIGDLRIPIPLFNIFLNEADEQSRRLCTELAEWALEHHQAVPESSIALAHSLAGNSATVGYLELSALARALEHALMRSRAAAGGSATVAALFSLVAEEMRRLLHQFAAGFLKPAPDDLLQRLLEHERAPAAQTDASDAAEPAMQTFEEPAAQAFEELAARADEASAAQAGAVPAAGWAAAPAVAAVEEGMVPAGVQADVLPPAEPAPESVDAWLTATAPGVADVPPAPVAIVLDLQDIDVHDAVDAELFPIFAEEAAELLPQLLGRLGDWLRQPADGGALSACMRTLHTFKGGARLAGAMRLGEMAHRLETAIDRLAAHKAPQAADIEPLLGGADTIATAFDALRRDFSSLPAAVPDPSGEIAVPFEMAAADDAGAVAIEPAPAPAPAPDTAAAPDGHASAPHDDGVAPLPLPATPLIDWSRFAAAAPSAPRPAPEPATSSGGVVRVRAELLDRLVSQAGEVSITRARLEVGTRLMQGALNDLGDNLERLRRQLRDIELQAETQIGARLEAAKVASLAFDPLEMDRFTRFQELTRFMAESVNDVATVQRALQRAVQGAEDELAAQARLTRELQDELLRTRMVEFESTSERLYRVVRQAAKESGRQVRMDIVGGAIEVDRGVLERMIGPFEHLLRNSVVHGIEPPALREQGGKDATGSIVVAVTHEGNEVGVEFRDDGAGLDPERIRGLAVARGLIAQDASIDAAKAAELIFLPGFSTADGVTELAGRGFGLDVVRSEVNAMGGRIETTSTPGQGTSFRLVLPLTTAVTQVVMLRAGARVVALPATLIETVRRLPDIGPALAAGQLVHEGEPLAFYALDALLQSDGRRGEISASETVVVLRSAAQRVALHVDEVLGNQEVVVKNLGPQLSRLPGLAGITLLPSGAAAPIYNPVALAAVYGDAVRAALQRPTPAQPLDGGAAAAVRAPLVLVVDDSLTVRRVTQRLLQREGYRVTLAKDGLEALDRLAEERPAVLLSDIEMPRMDGFDLLRNVRADARLAGLPVVMITSRTAQKHRDHADALGADDYLGKPFTEDELLAVLTRFAGADVRP